MPAELTIAGQMPATDSGRNWRYEFEKEADPMAMVDGTLTVIEETGKRVRRTVTSTYGVQFQPPINGCKRFLVCKQGHAGNLDTAAGIAAAVRVGEVYEVFVPECGRRPAACSCLGYARHRTCKHAVALAELVATGELIDPVAQAEREWDDFREAIESIPEDPEWDRLAGVGNADYEAADVG